jgi:hypothetical protein
MSYRDSVTRLASSEREINRTALIRTSGPDNLKNNNVTLCFG